MGIKPIERRLIELRGNEAQAVRAWYAANIANRHCVTVDKAPIEPWRFLCYLCDHLGLLAHGSNRPDLDVLIPVAKQRGDLTAFGNATQIFASPDALWAMWFALLNRDAPYRSGTANSCVRAVDPQGRVYKRYWFSVDYRNIEAGQHLTEGAIYLVPAGPFLHKNGQEWGSTEPVTPIARLRVSPADWPYRDAVLGFDGDRLQGLLQSDRGRFPWFEDDRLWRIVPDVYRR